MTLHSLNKPITLMINLKLLYHKRRLVIVYSGWYYFMFLVWNGEKVPHSSCVSINMNGSSALFENKQP